MDIVKKVAKYSITVGIVSLMFTDRKSLLELGSNGIDSDSMIVQRAKPNNHVATVATNQNGSVPPKSGSVRT